jgi:hypothetical protein
MKMKFRTLIWVPLVFSLSANAGMTSTAATVGPTIPVTPTAPGTIDPAANPTAAVNTAQSGYQKTSSTGTFLELGGAAVVAACLASQWTNFCGAGTAVVPTWMGYAIGGGAIVLGMMMDSGASGQSGIVQNGITTPLSSTNYGGASTGGNSQPTTTTTPGVASTTAPGVQSAIAAFKAAGGNINAATGTVTLPNGKSFNVSDAIKSGNMGNTGLSASDFKAGLASAVKDAKAQADAAAGTDGQDSATAGAVLPGSGPAAGKAAKAFTIPGMPTDPAALKAAAKPRAAASVEGASKLFNGVPIGVAQDNLFGLVNRRYASEVTQEKFLTPDAPATANANGVTRP